MPTIALDEHVVGSEDPEIDLLDLNDALTRLGALEPRQEQLVTLRFFGGLTIDETAAVLDISPATVKREWAAARAWMYRELQDKLPDPKQPET